MTLFKIIHLGSRFNDVFDMSILLQDPGILKWVDLVLSEQLLEKFVSLDEWSRPRSDKLIRLGVLPEALDEEGVVAGPLSENGRDDGRHLLGVLLVALSLHDGAIKLELKKK